MVRRARPEDEEAVLGFATRTWNDWDYVPHAWPRWLEARDGVLLVGAPGATSDGSPPRDAQGETLDVDRPIAIVRVALVAPGEAWLEAIRVDPRVRGMDIATDLQVAELHWAAAQRASIIRYATSARNEASHRLGARGGFELLTSFGSHWWSATGDPDRDRESPSAFLPEVQAAVNERRARLLERLASTGLVARADDGLALWNRLVADPGFIAGARLYEPRPWALEELTEAKFARHLERGEVIQATTDVGQAVGVLVRHQQPAEDSNIRLALLAGDGPAALALVETMREAAGEPINFRSAAEGGLVARNEAVFRDAGYTFPEWTLHILWRPLDEAHPPPRIDSDLLVMGDQPTQLLAPPD